jgi:hypothetical protein
LNGKENERLLIKVDERKIKREKKIKLALNQIESPYMFYPGEKKHGKESNNTTKQLF